MGRRAKVKPDSILDSAVSLVAQKGARGATIKAISARMAVNEASLYRHYRSKDDILASAYLRIVEEMAAEKQALAKSGVSFPELLREWIRITYAYFDKNPDAFAYVLLLPPPQAIRTSGIERAQGKIFLSLIRRALRAKEIRPLDAKLAYSHFSGIMLNVPRLIRDQVLRGPAVRYVDEVSAAVLRVLGDE
jgi:AcrR family transcriptional regulator